MNLKETLKTINPVALVAEMLGAFGLTFAVLAAAKVAGGGSQLLQQNPLVGGLEAVPVYLVSVPLVVAFTLAMFVMTVGKFSGGHFNPAVTVGMWSVKKIRTASAVAYILVQLLGAFAAFGVMQMFVPDATALVFNNSEPWKIFAGEALGMFIFAFGISAAVSQERSALESGFMIGGSLFLGLAFTTFAYGQLGGFLNPAIFAATVREAVADLSLGPIFGPAVGAVLGMGLYSVMNDPASVKMPKVNKLNLSGLKSKVKVKK